jgi:gliding motility-associated-like protein
VNSETICSGTTVALNASGADNYTWSPNTFLSATSGSTVNSTPTSSITYQIIGTNAGTGCKDTTTANISILPLPSIRLNNAAICVGKEARLFASGGINYTWGTGSNITTLAPDTILVKPASTTTYSVTGTDSTNGCKKTVQTTVIVNPLPALSINTPSICIGNNATITVSGANQYAWTPHPTLNTLTGASVTVSPATTTSYSVTGRSTSTGCENTTSTSVTVNPLPTGGISINGNNQFICDGYSVALIGTGGDIYQWYLNNAAIPGATSSTYQATRTGTYALELTSPFGCKNFVTSRPAFTVLTKPKADFRPPSGCIGNTLSFTNLSQSGQSGPVIYQWNFGDNSGSDLQNPQHTYLNKGAYSASLKVIPTTCPMLYDSSSSLVIIEAPVPGIRYPTVKTLINSSTTLRARTFGINYLWQPSVGLNNPLIVAPIFNDDEENDYIIRITNAYGCVTYDSVKVRIFGFSDIQVPTAFSPNGDGHNDKLDVFLIGIKELTFFKVFNRWGQLMFETNDRLQLWDGRFRDKDQPLETYVWIAQGIGIDGKKITKRGQTVLIR